MRIQVTTNEVDHLFSVLRSDQGTHSILQSLGQEMELQIDNAFHNQASPEGKPWPELSPITIALRRGSVQHKLVNTARLRNSFFSRVSGKTVAVGTDYFVATVQNQGRTILPKRARYLYFGNSQVGFFRLKKAVIPARKMYPNPGDSLPATYREAIDDVLKDHFRTIV